MNLYFFIYLILLKKTKLKILLDKNHIYKYWNWYYFGENIKKFILINIKKETRQIKFLV